MLSIIMLLITIAFAGIVMYNFDRGLKTQREFPCNLEGRHFTDHFHQWPKSPSQRLLV